MLKMLFAKKYSLCLKAYLVTTSRAKEEEKMKR